MNIIQYKGKIHVFEDNTDSVPDNIYLDRLWFIVKNMDKGSYDHIVNMSYIWMGRKHYNLEYDAHIMSALENF
jgi:hypothetical protein